jgi:glycosyltransferase involved in cell wall biosynthesis
MKAKKILFTIPNFKTAGSGKVVFDLLKGLQECFIVEVAVFEKGGALCDEIEKRGIKVHAFKFTEKGKPYWTVLKRIKRIQQFFKKNQIDLIHSWHYLDDWTEALAARMCGIPYVYTKKSMSWGGKDWIWRSRLSNRIITINTEMNRDFFPGWRKAVYMPLGLDLADYPPQKPSKEKLAQLFQPGDFSLVSVANMVPVKGIETAISALGILGNTQIKYFLVGACEANYRKSLEALISHHGLESQVFFMGKTTDVQPYLAGTDLFVIPTKNEGRKEGQPMAPIEAMSSQRLVAGSKIPGVTDILAEFPEFLFEAGNANELAAIIKRVMEMPQEERDKIALAMRQKVEREYNMERFIEGHRVLFSELLH